MKKLTIARSFTLTVVGLGVLTMLSLSACEPAGEATDQQETERTEEAATEESAVGSEQPAETPSDTTVTDESSQEVEHPSGSDEHPN